MPDSQSLLVLAPNWLGDAVMALPAIADIRRAFPSSRLVVAARRPVDELFRLVPHVNEVIAADLPAVQAAGADVAILLPNSFASAWLVWRAGVPERWGYAADLRRPLLTRAIARPGRGLHQAAYYQHLTRTFDIQPGPLEPSLTVPDAAIAAARSRVTTAGWDGRAPLFVLAPGAAYGTAKRWIPAHVARLIADLAGRRGATCVLVGSAGDRRTTGPIVAALDEAVRARVVDLAGETTLAELAGVLRLAQACVSNDSGAMHVAAAVGTPLVAIFGPTRERETAPLSRAGARAEVVTHQVWCRPCMLRECPIDHRCMTGITPERVSATLDRVMTA
jgi:heptosyltransferase-2